MNKYFSSHREVLSQKNTLLHVVMGLVLIVLTSQISIPLEPVPITMQTFGVLLVGLMFDKKESMYAVGSYLLLGAIGFPVFAEFQGGLHCLIGPTGGYLIGFLLAVMIMSSCSNMLDNKKISHIAIKCTLGTMVILCAGVAWLSVFLGLEKAISFGLMPFIVPGILKAVLLTMTIRYLKLGHG